MAEGLQSNGVLFCSAHHHVIFINHSLREMLKYPEKAMSTFIGEPVSAILGITEDVYQRIAAQIIAQGQADEVQLELHSRFGDTVTVLAQGVANRDTGGAFAGIDYAFRQTAAQVIQSQAADQGLTADMAQEVVRYYFKRQLEGLQEVMALWGGEQFSHYLNNVVNTTARQQGWAVSMDGSQITVDPASVKLDAYHGLLYKAAAYASDMLGDSLVRKQVQEINAHTNPTTFAYIDRDWVTRL